MKTNNDYRQYLIHNTGNIMNANFHLSDEGPKNSYPYLFNGLNDKKPYGYETSFPKEMYLSHMQINSNRVNPLKSKY
jgi:hypothetical protein